MGTTIFCLYSQAEIRLYQLVGSLEQDVLSGEVEKCPILHVCPKFDVFTLQDIRQLNKAQCKSRKDTKLMHTKTKSNTERSQTMGGT